MAPRARVSLATAKDMNTDGDQHMTYKQHLAIVQAVVAITAVLVEHR